MIARSARRSRVPAPRSSWSRAGSPTARSRSRRATGSSSSSTRSAARVGGPASAASRAAKLAGHAPGMARLRRQLARCRRRPPAVAHPARPRRRHASAAAPGLDRPRSAAAVRPAAAAGWAAAARRMDALVAHSAAGADAIAERLGATARSDARDPSRSLRSSDPAPTERPLPPSSSGAEGPVVLLLRPHAPLQGHRSDARGVREIQGAELWIVGRPMMDLTALRDAGTRARSPVRWVPRFITDPEIPALFRRADLVVLPYREADQSGVLYTALAFGNAIVASSVGGFPEVAAQGDALRLVPPGDAGALAGVLPSCSPIATRGPARRRRARQPPPVPIPGTGPPRETLDLYRSLPASRPITTGSARDRLLDLRGADRLDPSRLSARALAARPRSPRGLAARRRRGAHRLADHRRARRGADDRRTGRRTRWRSTIRASASSSSSPPTGRPTARSSWRARRAPTSSSTCRGPARSRRRTPRWSARSRWGGPPRVRLVDHVVVVEGRQVDELDRDRARDQTRVRRVAEVAAQQHEHRAEPLAARLQQVLRGLGEQVGVGAHALLERLLDAVEAPADLPLEDGVGGLQPGDHATAHGQQPPIRTAPSASPAPGRERGGVTPLTIEAPRPSRAARTAVPGTRRTPG